MSGLDIFALVVLVILVIMAITVPMGTGLFALACALTDSFDALATFSWSAYACFAAAGFAGLGALSFAAAFADSAIAAADAPTAPRNSRRLTFITGSLCITPQTHQPTAFDGRPQARSRHGLANPRRQGKIGPGLEHNPTRRPP